MTSPSPRRGPGRPARIDTQDIARAVLDVGFAGLTFAAVAERLGVGQATLYRHASNRDELVRLGLDRALNLHAWPALDGPWQPMLESWAISSWRAWEQHPGAVVEAARGVVPPSIVLLSNSVAAALVARGFRANDAVLAVDLVFDLAADSRRGVETIDAPLPELRAGMRADLERRWATTSIPLGDTAVHAAMVAAIRADPFEWFHGKLRIVLAGIRIQLAPAHSPDPASSQSTTGLPE